MPTLWILITNGNNKSQHQVIWMSTFYVVNVDVEYRYGMRL